MFKILVVDDDSDLRLTVTSALSENSYRVEQARDGEECVNRIKADRHDLVLLDVNMPRLSGLEALKEIKAHDPSIIVIMLTAFSNVRDAVEATKEGAYNYLEKPIKAENLVYLVQKALKARSMVRNLSLSAPVFRLPGGTDFIGQSSEMKRIFGVIDKLSRVETAVLIRGESGTGKELVAQALHFNGLRKDNRFVTVNCSAIPENLIESEFFGHEKGAFTGADSRKIGKFQYADGGTLFLDEIGDISPAMQVKLLRVLQDKRFTPVGSNREIESNVRIVAATNRNLEEMIRKGQFREDLFYRLNVLPIELPPLRERRNDIEHLARYFVEKFNLQHRKSIGSISTEAMELLRQHAWPGNIRELENVIEHAFVIEGSEQIEVDSLPAVLRGQGIRVPKPQVLKEAQTSLQDPAGSSFFAFGSGAFLAEPASSQLAVLADEDATSDDSDLRDADEDPIPEGASTAASGRLDFQAQKEEFEKAFLIQALKTFRGRINQTALHANIPKKTLLRKIEKYGIKARDYS
jgi:DNA-binding NtrC family response regulator